MVYLSYVLMTVLGFSGVFLIGLILLQRGRGGGLAGAFGGMGGQSAFGTKAGDVFTRITIGVATAWILLCGTSVIALHNTKRVDKGAFASGTDKDGAETSKADAVIPKLGEGVPVDDKKPEGKPDKADVNPDDAAKKVEIKNGAEAGAIAPATDTKVKTDDPEKNPAAPEKPGDPETKAEEKKTEEPAAKPDDAQKPTDDKKPTDEKPADEKKPE